MMAAGLHKASWRFVGRGWELGKPCKIPPLLLHIHQPFGPSPSFASFISFHFLCGRTRDAI